MLYVESEASCTRVESAVFFTIFHALRACSSQTPPDAQRSLEVATVALVAAQLGLLRAGGIPFVESDAVASQTSVGPSPATRRPCFESLEGGGHSAQHSMSLQKGAEVHDATAFVSV